MSQQSKVLFAKPRDLNSIWGPHVRGRELTPIRSPLPSTSAQRHAVLYNK